MTPEARRLAARLRAFRERGVPIVAVVMAPVGPPCTVLTVEGVSPSGPPIAAGMVIHGYRVADDAVGCQSEVVFRGFCVEAVFVNQYGTPCESPTGRPFRAHDGNGKIPELWEGEGTTTRLRITAAIPPDLPPPRRVGRYFFTPAPSRAMTERR